MKILSLLSFLLLSSFLFVQCQNMPDNIYKYADGSGNVYTITPDSLTYTPVTPQNSSSGIYSGGDPNTVSISGDQYLEIVNAIQQAGNNSDAHSEKRTMGSGQVSIYENDKNNLLFILKMNSKEKKAIESVLKTALSFDQ